MKAKKRSQYQEKVGTPPLPELRPLTIKQSELMGYLQESSQVIVTGVAGTGKTYVSATHAARCYLAGVVSKVILTRPNIPAGRGLGYLPGTLEEKIAPWLIPFTDVLRNCLGQVRYDAAIKRKSIEIVPFEIMRGRTFDNAFILLDEAQNTTPHEIKMFLTRIGENSRVVINGDIKQSDLTQNSGLSAVIKLIQTKHLGVPVIEFGLDDIVRSDICAMWVRAFEG
jgi:phosphate starvation-inducible PhoH-like protein